MAKSNYLSGILLLSFIGVYIGIGSNNIESQEPRTKSQDLRPVFGNVVHLSSADLNLEKADAQTSDFRPPTSVTILRNRVKTIYDSQIGVRETGWNGGPQVEKYLRYAGLSKGNPWCAAFVCWVLGEAGVVNPRSGWSPDLFGKGRVIWRKGEQGTKSKEQRLPTYVPGLFPSSLATGIWTKTRSIAQGARPTTIPRGYPISPTTNNKQPTTSDVFGIYFPERKRIAHVGFVDVWDGSWLITVEGNTNSSGGREGDGVYRKRRPLRSIYRVARYIN